MKTGDLVRHRASGKLGVVVGVGEREAHIPGRAGYGSTRVVETGDVTVSIDYGSTVDAKAIELEALTTITDEQTGDER